tara:strand:+ start:74 stop:229 length:156 start_codon:yes stop_codon:yes gene_type:complete
METHIAYSQIHQICLKNLFDPHIGDQELFASKQAVLGSHGKGAGMRLVIGS